MSQSKFYFWLVLLGLTIGAMALKVGHSRPVPDSSTLASAPRAAYTFMPYFIFKVNRHFEDDMLDTVISKLRQWNAETDPDAREKIEGELESLLTSTNAGEILAQLPAEFLETPFAGKAFALWSQRDAAAALQWLAGNPNPSTAQIEIAAGNWFTQNAEGLSDYLNALPDGHWKQQVLSAAADVALKNNSPEDAALWLTQLSPPNLGMADEAAKMWGQKNFTAAVAWANAQSDASLRDRLLADAVAGFAQNNPVAAIEFARDNLETDDAKNRAVQGIVSAWAGSDPAAAASWLAEFPQGEMRNDAIHILLYTWSNGDLAAAKQWVSTQLAGNERNAAIEQMVSSELQSDSAAAANLVAQLSPGQAQDDLGTGIIRRWAMDDFHAAQDWVNQLPSGTFQQLAFNVLGTVANQSSNKIF